MSQTGGPTSSSSAAMSIRIADEVFGKDAESPLCLPEERPPITEIGRPFSILEASFDERVILSLEENVLMAKSRGPEYSGTWNSEDVRLIFWLWGHAGFIRFILKVWRAKYLKALFNICQKIQTTRRFQSWRATLIFEENCAEEKYLRVVRVWSCFQWQERNEST